MSEQGEVRQTSQGLAALLGSSVESIRRWKVSLPNGLTPDAVADAKDSVGALRGWWPRGEMPGEFRNTKPWKTKEELAETRKSLAVKIGVHVNTLRVLWRNGEIPPLPPDGALSPDYIAMVANHPIIRACKLTEIKKELAARVGESVPTLHHLWRHAAIPQLPPDGKLRPEYVADVRNRAKRWRSEIREQKKLAAERKTRTATRNREAAQKKRLNESLKTAGLGTTPGTVRRWLRKGQIPSLPSDGSLPAEYLQVVVDFAKLAKERHRENTRLGQNRPGVQRRKSKSQKLAARRPGVKARKSAVKKDWWAKTKAELAGRRVPKKRGGSQTGKLQKGTAARILIAADCRLQGMKPYQMPPHLYPIHYSPKRNDHAAAWRATQSLLRRHRLNIEKSMAELAASSESERQAILDAARKVIKQLP